jgi:hypothetical protein
MEKLNIVETPWIRTVPNFFMEITEQEVKAKRAPSSIRQLERCGNCLLGRANFC